MTSFDNFLYLDPDSAQLARQLVNANEDQRSAFSSFMSAWMGFNGWMECVTGAETDAAMIDALANHSRVIGAYELLLRNDAQFLDSVSRFAAMFPVLSVRDVKKKLGRDAFRTYDRSSLLTEVVRAAVRHQPQGWSGGQLPSWEQLLRTVYMVRCNLFHGSKSSESFRDHQLVSQCDAILRRFIDGSRCFSWSD